MLVAFSRLSQLYGAGKYDTEPAEDLQLSGVTEGTWAKYAGTIYRVEFCLDYSISPLSPLFPVTPKM